MINWKKSLCAGVVGALLLGLTAGCGGSPTPAATPDPDDVAYQTAGISRDTVLFTVDGTEVTADSYLFWLLNSITDAQYNGYLADEEAWAGEIEGVPAGDYLKSQALETSKLYTVVGNQAAARGITLSEEELATNQAELAELEENISYYYGGLTMQEWLERQCISLDAFNGLNSVAYLAQDLQSKLEEDGELSATDAELDELVDQLGYYKAKHILLAFPTDESGSTANLTEEQKAALKEEADGLLAQIRGAEDPYGEFDRIMNERSEDGRDENGDLYSPDGYLAYAGQMVPQFENGARALSPGEFSEPIETAYGYHIILRLEITEEEQQQLRDSVAPYHTNLAMTELNQKWVDEAVVETTPAYEALDPKDFYEKLTALNEEKEAQRTAQASPAPQESGEPEPEASPPPQESANP